MLADLGVQVRTGATVTAATEEGFRLADGQLVEGGVFVWAGGLKAPDLVAGSELPTGHNGRVKVDQYLRVLDHPEVYVAGDLASVVDPRTGHVLPALAQVALEEGETVARNLDAELAGPTAGSVHLQRQRVRRLGRDPPRGRRHRRHHHRRAAGPPAQGRDRVGAPPVRPAPARLGPSTRVTRPSGCERPKEQMHDPILDHAQPHRQIIPICVIGAGSDEIGAARRSAGRSAVFKTPLRCVVATVTQLCGQRTGRIFMHRRASGEHPNLPRTERSTESRACLSGRPPVPAVRKDSPQGRDHVTENRYRE